jgi:DNA-binding NarL/FixJ family response regulator
MSSPSVAVLIVDDQASYRAAAATLVEAAAGFHVGAVACSGEEALDSLQRRDYGLVLLDVQMPGMGGLDAADRIRARHPRTVVVLMSATDRVDLPAQADRLGVSYINKAELGPDELGDRWLVWRDQQMPSSRMTG